MNGEAEQLTIFDPDTCVGKTYREHSARQAEKISGSFSRRSSELKTAPVQCLDLTPGGGNLLGPCWEVDSAWLGDVWTLNTGVSPSEERESSLSQILEDNPHSKYSLGKKSCLGILRRARERGKKLPAVLEKALVIQAGLGSIKTK